MNIDRNGGFTLIELISSLAIMFVLAGVALPSFNNLVERNRATTETNEFIGQLAYARTEAIKRGTHVSLCASADGLTCSGSTDWKNGWIIFSDSTGTSGVKDSGDELLKVHESLSGNTTLDGRASFVRYSPYGVIGS